MAKFFNYYTNIENPYLYYNTNIQNVKHYVFCEINYSNVSLEIQIN